MCMWSGVGRDVRLPSHAPAVCRQLMCMSLLHLCAISSEALTVYLLSCMCSGTQGGVFNVAGVLYAVVLFLGVQNTSTVQPVFAIERTGV